VNELIWSPTFMLRSVLLVGRSMPHHRRVIIRLVHARTPGSTAPPTGVPPQLHNPDEPRQRLARASARVNGLETLVVGWRAGDPGASAFTPSVVVVAWRDAESMIAAIGRDETGFLRERLGLTVDTDGGESYEVISRTFGSLPAPTSVLRIITMAARASVEAGLFERLRDIQRWLTDHGLIASHIARRVVPAGIEVLVIGVWIDHDAIDQATLGHPERPAFIDEIGPLIESSAVETYDALEIAPRLPLSSGPPILVLDGSRRVVDLTPSAAAMLGRTQDEALGMLVEDLAAPGDRDAPLQWSRLLHEPPGDGLAAGEAAWVVPSGGEVMIRWLLRRDAPVRGRHTILVRRRQEAEPTALELEGALAEAFPTETDRPREA
jgi:PAS domain-containing protein